jgi:hypothetical protein
MFIFAQKIMTKLFYPFLLFSIFLLISCGEDEVPEQPPTEVSNIDVVVVEGTMVRIRWKESEDPNGDDIYYDIVVNNFLVDERAVGDYIEYDIKPLLNKSFRKESSKGTNINLNIKIKAYDTKNNVSDTTEANRNIFVNRDPGNFEFVSINFDTYSFNGLEVVWSPAPDEDGDSVTYNVYLNNLLIKENYTIDSNSYNGLGSVYYGQSFYSYLEEEIVIKVVADDNSGGQNEITRSYNFRATDLDLGALQVPSESAIDFAITTNETDNRIGYNFSIAENTGLSLMSQSGVEFYLRDENGNNVISGYNRIFIESLSSGSYYLEIFNYSGGNRSGSFLLNLRDSKETDVNLNQLSVPYEGVHSFNASSEPDNYVGFLFSLTETTGLFINEASSNNYYVLLDGNGNSIRDGYNGLFVNPIEAGNYELRVYNGQNSTSNFTLMLQDPTLTDVDLGSLAIPYLENYTFFIEANEPDNVIAYKFSVTETTGIVINSNSQNYYKLLDGNGNYIYTGYNIIKYASLPPGDYKIEVEKNGSNATGDFSLALQHMDYTDADLGFINTLPYTASLDTNILNSEPDSSIFYKIEVDQEMDYNFFTNSDVYVTFYDQNKNYISGNYQRISGTIPTSGVYYIQLMTYGYETNGDFNIEFK